ncbi:unnamed protein product [Meloidogyne enterolobii]|uniref:Uncharacterized protein n=1 Tax=Meloidogyne enterolobii TaxID=390850 RepID=A0ACB1AVU5_MELEN
MFWYCCDSLKFGSAKREIKQIIKSNSIENDERFASIFTYNSERNYGGNRYNTAFDWGGNNQFSQLPTTLEEQFPNNQNVSNKIGEFICTMLSLLFFIITLPFSLFFTLKFINPFQKAVVMRLGKCQNKVYGQGMILLLPFIDEVTIVDLRVSTIELPTIYLFTTDRGIVELSCVVLIQIIDPIIACCTVQNIKQVFLKKSFLIKKFFPMLNLLVYTALHRHLGKRMLSDITNPNCLAKHVASCKMYFPFRKCIFFSSQNELDQFIHKYGVKIDAINITKINVIKLGENGAVSIFKTLIRSDVGKQFLDVFGCPVNNLNNFMSENGEGKNKEKNLIKLSNEESKKIADTFSTASTEKQNSPSILNSISEEKIVVEEEDNDELDHLLQRIRLVLFQNCGGGNLLKRVNKCFRVKCTDCLNNNEFDIDLRESSGGWCGWTWQREGGFFLVFLNFVLDFFFYGS